MASLASLLPSVDLSTSWGASHHASFRSGLSNLSRIYAEDSTRWLDSLAGTTGFEEIVHLKNILLNLSQDLEALSEEPGDHQNGRVDPVDFSDGRTSMPGDPESGREVPVDLGGRRISGNDSMESRTREIRSPQVPGRHPYFTPAMMRQMAMSLPQLNKNSRYR